MLPSREDRTLRGGSEGVGGPAGRRIRLPGGWWTPIRVLLVLATGSYLLGYLLDLPCVSNGWASPDRYQALCYSDIPPLYALRGFAEGLFPYLDSSVAQEVLEYPVLTGLFMFAAAALTRASVPLFGDVAAGTVFFHVNVVLLFPFLLLAVAATAATVRRRPWDAAMVAVAPGVILASTINWDLVAVGLTAAALLVWSRRHPTWAGVLLGLAVAAKFYPVVLLGPWLLLCLRAGRLRDFGRLLLGFAGTWLVVNLPFMLANFDGWARFYVFSNERGQDFGSVWYAVSLLGGGSVPKDLLNEVATGSFLLLCVGIGWLMLGARRRPRLAQGLFLVVAAFALTNKVYSPQYVLWLIPLAALARPRWRDFLIWQAGEVVYFLAVWWFLAGYGVDGAKGLTQQWYAVAVFVHVLATLWFAGMVVRDILRPEHDPVRSDPFPEDDDDPGGGCLNGAPDVVVLPPARRTPPAPADPLESGRKLATPTGRRVAWGAWDVRATGLCGAPTVPVAPRAGGRFG